MLGTRIPVAVVALTCACSGGVACVQINAGETRYVDTVEKQFAVTAAPTVSLVTFDGSVEVDTWDQPEVKVVIERHAVDKAAAEKMQISATQDGNAIAVEVRRDQAQRTGGLNITIGSHTAHLKVTVPRRSTVEAKTGDGRVAVRGLDGDVTVRTGDGSIQLTGIAGAVDAASGDGSIQIEGAITRLNTRSGDGRVAVRAAAGSAPSTEWSISTGDGVVALELPDGFNANLDATTGDGRVMVNVPFTSDGETDRRRSAQGRIGAGGPTIRIRSGDGGIVIRRADDNS